MLGVSTDYFTSKIEIKPQHDFVDGKDTGNYFTSKIEIKPQQFDFYE